MVVERATDQGVQRLLRPDQAEAAVTLARSGADAERIAWALSVPVEVVLRSVRVPEPAEVAAFVPAPVVSVRSEPDPLEVLWPRPAGPDDGPGSLPPSGLMELGPVLVVGERLSVRKLLRPSSWRAPVFVEDCASWPPAPAPEDRWHVVPVRDGRDWVRTALREVVLWDARVLVDGDRRVFCSTCSRLLGVVELGRDLFRGEDGVFGGNLPRHRLGMPALPPGGAAA